MARHKEEASIDPNAHPAAHSLSLLNSNGGKKMRLKSLWVKMKTSGSFTCYHHGQNSLVLGRINFIYCQLKQILVMRNGDKKWPQGASILAEGRGCALGWVVWSQHRAVPASPHRSYPDSPPPLPAPTSHNVKHCREWRPLSNWL